MAARTGALRAHPVDTVIGAPCGALQDHHIARAEPDRLRLATFRLVAHPEQRIVAQ